MQGISHSGLSPTSDSAQVQVILRVDKFLLLLPLLGCLHPAHHALSEELHKALINATHSRSNLPGHGSHVVRCPVDTPSSRHTRGSNQTPMMEGIGTVLEQKQNGDTHYHSHSHQLKCATVLLTRNLWLHMLQLGSFNHSMRAVLAHRSWIINPWFMHGCVELWSPRQYSHSSPLAEFFPEVIHRSGNDNIVTDTLSCASFTTTVNLGIKPIELVEAESQCLELQALLYSPT